MREPLPIFWFALAGLGVAVAFVLPFLMLASPYQGFYTLVPQACTGAVWMAGFGLVYAFVLKTRPSMPVRILGFIHLILTGLARALVSFGQMLMFQVAEGGMTGDLQARTLFLVSSEIASLLASLVFLTVMIVALNTRAPAPETF